MAAELAELHQKSFADECWSINQIQGSMELPTTTGWATFKNDQLLGFILCQIAADEAEILTFCVSPEARRQGVGEMMTKHVIKNISSCSSIHLEVASDNLAAITIYERCGFTKTSERKNYYKRKKTFADAINYTYRYPK